MQPLPAHLAQLGGHLLLQLLLLPQLRLLRRVGLLLHLAQQALQGWEQGGAD